MGSLVKASGLDAGYNGSRAIRALELEVGEGEVVALLGANGAGKTTTVLSLAGELEPLSGSISWLGHTGKRSLQQRARHGLALVTEERSVFTRLSVRQNLAIGRGCNSERALEIFPELRPLLDRRAGLLSGGEQQMLTMGRALARPTKLLLADELSLGLAPITVGKLLAAVRQAADRGMGALLVEQQVERVLTIADRVYVMRTGEVVFHGTAQEARANLEAITTHYLGHDAATPASGVRPPEPDASPASHPTSAVPGRPPGKGKL